MDRAIIIESANTATEQLTGWTPWQFTWGPIRKGGCTMIEGAAWTLFPNGTAILDATVTCGEDNGAWVIWHVDLLDRNNAVLGSLASEHPIEGDWRKFVKHMPDSGERYRFRALATFDTALWTEITGLKMFSSC